MAYVLQQLAPGSYDLILDGETIGSVVRSGSTGAYMAAWYAELLAVDSEASKPAPFVEIEHGFDTLADLMAWLGEPEMIRNRGR